MGTKIYIPKMGANISKAKVCNLLVKKGDLVQKGDHLFEIETEKAIFPVDAESDGKVLALECKLGDNYEVLDEVGYIGNEGESVPELKRKVFEDAGEKRVDIKVTPSAKKLAAENGLDINSVFQGENKIIKEEDVQSYLDSENEENVSVKDISSRKKLEIENISQSRDYIVSSVTVAVSTNDIKKKVDQLAKENNINLNQSEYIAYKTVQALKKYPLLNSYYHSDKLHIYDQINFGIAVNVDGNLIVPVVMDAGKLSITEFSEKVKNLIMNTIKKELLPEDMQNGTFTISDLSAFNVLNFSPIINVKQAAILGVGSEYDSYKLVGEKLAYDPKMNLTLTFDHRVTDGKSVAEFLNELIKLE
jgi:pyruvate dehydrogenase E2 component (dihydrolipoamide acetyltransferase)